MYVCKAICMLTFSNISSENTGSIEAKFHLALPGDGETKVYSNDPSHMHIYGKNLKHSSTPELKV